MLIGHHKIVYDAENAGWNIPPDPETSNKTSPGIGGNSTCVDGTTGKKCKVCTLEKPCLYDVWADDSEVNNLAHKMPDLVKSMNKTFSELVLKRRMPAKPSYDKQNGWDCKQD